MRKSGEIAEARLKEIEADIRRFIAIPADRVSDKQLAHYTRLLDEGEALQAQLATQEKAKGMSIYASPEEFGRAGMNPSNDFGPSWAQPSSKGVIDHPIEQKAAEHGLAARKHIAPSMFHMSDKQLQDLYAAGRSNMSFGFTTGKGGDQNMSLVDKTVSEGAVGSLLPPDLLPNAFPLRLEPARISEYFTQIQADGQSVSFVQHSASSLAADGSGMAVAENATKPTLGMTLSAKTIQFTVVAAIETISRQLWEDFGTVSSFLPSEITNQVIQGENYQIISGDGTAPDQAGLLSQSGILTRAASTTGTDTAIDDVLNAANDIRVSSSYANANLVVLNPSDWLSIRRIKSSQGLYVLDQNDPGQLGGIDHLFQLRVASTTSIPQGTALILDTNGVNIFRRWGLEVQVNPYAGDEFKANQLVVRAETRLGVACLYPHMVCKLTGLFPPA